MLIGLTFNLKIDPRNPPLGPAWRTFTDGEATAVPAEGPDDIQEEYDSPATVQALADVIAGLGHEVHLLGSGPQLVRRLMEGPRPDFVFNIAEGVGIGRSREAQVPALLETLGIPYSGSDPLTLAVTLDKDCAKRLVRDRGLATPRWVLVDGPAEGFTPQLAELPLPMIVKPAFEGSSKGVRATSLVADRGEAAATINRLMGDYRQPILVEEFIDGDELTVGILGNRPPSVLGILRVLPKKKVGPFIYSIEVKRDWRRLVEYECPAGLSKEDDECVRRAALAVWEAVGCRDVARVDFRLRRGVPYFLEVNPLPGLSPGSGDIVLLAEAVGIPHAQLVQRILQAAIDRVKAGET